MSNNYNIYYENPVGRAVDDPMGFARLTYQAGLRPEDGFKALLGQVTKLLAQREDGCLLIDQRLMAPFTPEEQQHVIQQWLPRTVKECGYRYGAVLVAQDVFARLATATVIAAVRDLSITYQYFEQEAEAITWLMSQQRQAVRA
ncbi:hypothetical protein H8B13_01390 [Hymenobacter sp. BT188]|uniref:hypothetical protein n=1 Tax=Hymenobacter sp. BT188 TaxID=2763504 RepID=UPI0016519629|nr:hypothetical protein [Hymenobacter sp. BT188]MBC6605463.1 hypothetical protein [Hymenobacter sp. BT188]